MLKVPAVIVCLLLAIVVWYFFPLFRDASGKLVIYDLNTVPHFCPVDYVFDCRYVPDPPIAPGTEHLTSVTTYETEPPTRYERGEQYQIVSKFFTPQPHFLMIGQNRNTSHRIVLEWYSLKPDAIFGTTTPLIFNIAYWLMTAGIILVIFFGISTWDGGRAGPRGGYR